MVATASDPGFINASAGLPAYSANELRQFTALPLQYGGRVFGARQGVRPGGTALQTSIAGSTITVKAGVACVDPGLTTVQGPYAVVNPVDATLTLTAAHATLPRKDITVLRVYDHDEDASGLRQGIVEYIAGVAAGSPSEPAVPAGAVKLATIDVPASGGGSPSVTINFPFAVAAGAVLPIRNQTERDALSAFDGLTIYRMDRDWLEIHDGTAFRVQGVAICSSTADRDSAITHPVNGNQAVTTDTGMRWNRVGGAWVGLPQGFMGEVKRATTDSGIGTTETMLETVTCSNLASGVRYRVTWNGLVALSVAPPPYPTLRLRYAAGASVTTAGTVIVDPALEASTVNRWITLVGTITAPSSGQFTFGFSAQSAGASPTVSVTGSATKRLLLVEGIGG